MECIDVETGDVVLINLNFVKRVDANPSRESRADIHMISNGDEYGDVIQVLESYEEIGHRIQALAADGHALEWAQGDEQAWIDEKNAEADEARAKERAEAKESACQK